MRSLLALNKYFLRYKKKLLLGVLFILIANSAQVIVPIILQRSIDELNSDFSSEQLMFYAALVVGASLISGLFRFLIRQTIIVVSREIEYDVRQDFWAHIQKLAFRFFQQNTTGNLMAHATNDISAVRMYVGPGVMYSIDTITKFIIIISIMLSYNPLLTLYTLLPLPFLSYFVYKLSTKIHIKFTKIQEKFSELTTKAQESFSGIRVIKSYVREQSEIDGFDKLSKDYLESNMAKVRIQAFFMPILFLITGVSIIIVIWVGGTMVIDGALTIGDMTAFVVYLGMLIWPVIAFGWVMNLIQQASASMKRVNKILDEEIDIKDSEETHYSINTISGDIEFKNVSFRYNEEQEKILDDVSLQIKKGTSLAIVGQTGVGKTTFVNLLSRLYEINSGDILIDGQEIKKIPLSILRSKIGFVPQETFLFSDTLANNIFYGTKNKSDELLKSVSEISKLDKDVESFPNGYETILGERGITLSGGQKQRTCLARALAIDPKILILDDSFSAVDTNTEEEILIKLKEFMKDRTSIIISHRISTVKDADNIIVLDNGKISEQGTHDELISKDGYYSELHFKQLLEKELEQI